MNITCNESANALLIDQSLIELLTTAFNEIIQCVLVNNTIDLLARLWDVI